MDHELVLSRRLLVVLVPNHVDREDGGLWTVGLLRLLLVGPPGHHPVLVADVGIEGTMQAGMMLLPTPLYSTQLVWFSPYLRGAIIGLVTPCLIQAESTALYLLQEGSSVLQALIFEGPAC